MSGCEHSNVAFLEQRPVIDARRYVLDVADDGDVDFTSQQQFHELLGPLLVELDVEAGDELRNFCDRLEHERDRD